MPEVQQDKEKRKNKKEIADEPDPEEICTPRRALAICRSIDFPAPDAAEKRSYPC